MLLLGYQGMLGSALFEKLSAAHEVSGISRRELDITSEEACRRLISAAAPDVVVNAAAYTNVDGCEVEREKCFAVNALGVKNIALACRERAINVVHFSTDYVFDGGKNSPYHESDECRPVNAYGLSKLEAERLLEAFSHNFLIIRSSWLYGINGRNFVSTILEKAGSVGRLEVVTDQVGSPTSTGDLAAATATLIEEGHRGIFHAANGGHCSWYDFTREILRCRRLNDVAVLPITSDKLTRPAVRPPYSVLDCLKYTSATGRGMRTWQEALQEYLNKYTDEELRNEKKPLPK